MTWEYFGLSSRQIMIRFLSRHIRVQFHRNAIDPRVATQNPMGEIVGVLI